MPILTTMQTRLLAVATCAICTAARGTELAEGRLSINGSGGAAFAISGNNEVHSPSMTATPDGVFENLDVNLTLTARITSELTVASQLFFDELDGPASGIDWTFAELHLSKWLKVRAGKVKLPFGISNEVESVGTLRPFYSLPESVYGNTTVATRAYYGAGATGELLSGQSWTLDYDVFGGEATLSSVRPFAVMTKPPDPNAPPGPPVPVAAMADRVHSLFGGRLIVGTPLEGLSLRVSAYRGRLEDATLLVAMLSIEYSVDDWLLRAEGYRSSEQSINHGGYVEVARFVTPHVQLAAQLQGLRTHARAVPDDSPLLWHASASLGLNYWFTQAMVVKAAFSKISGNRLAFPPQLDASSTRNLSEDTPLFSLGTQFSF